MAQLPARPIPIPTAPPVLVPNSVVAWLQQFTPWQLQSPLTPHEFEQAAITMRTRLTTSTTSGTQTFRVRSTHVLLIKSIRGHLAFNAVTGETLAITGVGNPGVLERMQIKAMNCRMTLENQDRTIPLFAGGQDLPLSQILTNLGGKPLEFDPPHIVLPGQTLSLATTLQDTTGAIVGGSTDYGVQVDGYWLRVSE